MEDARQPWSSSVKALRALIWLQKLPRDIRLVFRKKKEAQILSTSADITNSCNKTSGGAVLFDQVLLNLNIEFVCRTLFKDSIITRA